MARFFNFVEYLPCEIYHLPVRFNLNPNIGGFMKALEYLKSKNMTITQFCTIVNYERKHLTDVLKRRARASRRMINAIVEASNGELQTSDFLMVERDMNK